MSDETSAPTATTTDAMLRRVQLLLAKASDPAATPEESATYMEKATDLMARYGIDQALLNAQKPAGQREQVTTKRIWPPAPYAREKRNLLGWLATPLHCKAILVGPEIMLFGFPSDLERVEMLYSSLMLQATRDMLNAYVPYGVNVAAWRRTFLVGFAAVVSKRVEQAYGRIEAEAERTDQPGTALVLVERTKQVDLAIADMFPKLTKGRRRQLSGGGRRAGGEAGARADIGNRAGVGGSRTPLGR